MVTNTVVPAAASSRIKRQNTRLDDGSTLTELDVASNPLVDVRGERAAALVGDRLALYDVTGSVIATGSDAAA